MPCFLVTWMLLTPSVFRVLCRGALGCGLLALLLGCAGPGIGATDDPRAGMASRVVGLVPGSAAEPQAAAGPAAGSIDASDAGMAALALLMPRYEVVLLGEVHDNPTGHALRREALAAALAAGWRPALAMEQFDSDQQAALDQAMAMCADATCVIGRVWPAGTGQGWDWTYYKPVIDLALRYRLPVMAANFSRKQASQLVKHGLDATFSQDALAQLGLSTGPDAALLRAQEQEVDQGHCGMLPPNLLPGMAAAQIIRDATMARSIRIAAGGEGADALRPVVLLAGNGHVRRDLGVPRWQHKALAVGFTEAPAPAGRFDLNVVLPPAVRPDPCEAFRHRS